MKIKVEDGDIQGVTVVLRNLTSGENNEIPGQQRMDLELRMNNNYVISFTKQGYITKKIAFDTRMPVDRSSQELYPFNFEVILFPQYEGLNVVVFNQPVAKIFYDPLLDDFDYDTDYTKQIQSALKKAEEELVQRQKEEHKLTEEKKKVEQQQLALEEKQKKEEERKNREEEKRIKAENDKRIAEERRLQKIEEDKRKQELRSAQAEERRSVVASVGQDRGPVPPGSASGIDSRSAIQSNSGSETRVSSGEQGSDSSSGNYTIQSSGVDTRNGKVQEGSGADGRNLALSSGTGNDSRVIEKASQNHGSDSKQTNAGIGSASIVDSAIVSTSNFETKSISAGSDILVEEYRENGKKVTKVSFSNDPYGKVFMKVIYDWGGVYYFESGRYISQAYFFSVTNIR